MFRDSRAFGSFAVDDIAAARTFYGETLGLDVEEVETAGGLLSVSLAGGGRLMIYPKPDYIPATFTVLTFPVDNIDKAVEQLTGAGIRMDRYDGFDQDDKGVDRSGLGPAIAWFRDPAGNILAVVEDSGV